MRPVLPHTEATLYKTRTCMKKCLCSIFTRQELPKHCPDTSLYTSQVYQWRFPTSVMVVLHFGTSHEKQSSFITFAYCGIEGRQTLISEKNNMQQISFVFHPENTNLTMTCLQYFTFFCL